MATLSTDFTAQVMSFRDGLRYFALSLTRNEEDSNDLVQETMLKAFTYKDRFQENTNLKAWLYTIMKNIFINNYRRNAKAKTILDHSPNTYYINLPQNAKSVDPDSQLSFKEISETINNLDIEYRIPLTMYFEGFKYKEIADDLNLPIGTVKSRIFLARKQLMSTLKEYAK
ncbi:MAG: sigma-70 family RNA polymerase sigma factor [Flavobacteriales bacterium]|nr:sigma-70 family RNA polymerase sigma factor [Flavobacteriales bacterium]